jgi:OPA family glycerol-3-phosphate transporter-like MFS transporter
MPESGMTALEPPRQRALRRQQALLVCLLFGGYAALYFCRADLSVATPLLADELAAQGMSHGDALLRLGAISSLGVLAYALGKLFLCGLGDVWGGRISFLIGLAGATVFTLLFTTHVYVPLFTLAWFGNRLTQSVAWAGLLKVTAKWFDFASHGTIIGVLSISYLIGDALARQCMGLLIQTGAGFRPVFYFAAAVAGLFFVANYALLRESRVAAGFPEAMSNPLNLFAAQRAPRRLREFLLPLLRSRAFLLVCLLSLGCTIIRETFNAWTPVYLHDYLGYSMSRAAGMSAVFPALGAVSILAAGWLSDRLGVNGRPLLLFLGLAATTAALWVLMSLHASTTAPEAPLLAIGSVAFCLLGPYSYLGGAFALDFGGKEAAAIASGIIDGVGYLGAVLATTSAAHVAVTYGWQRVFFGLGAVSVLAAVGAGLLYRGTTRAARLARVTA